MKHLWSVSKQYLRYYRIGLIDSSGSKVMLATLDLDVSNFVDAHPKYVRLLSKVGDALIKYNNIRYKITEHISEFRYEYLHRPKVVRIPELAKHFHHDTDTILFYACFSSLVNFVETEFIYDIETYRFPEIFEGRKIKLNRRYPDIAKQLLRHLEANPKVDETDPYTLNELEILTLYGWFTEVYLPREKLSEYAISSEMAEKIFEWKGIENTISARHNISELTDITPFYEQETQQMLLRLMAIRPSLWT